MLHCALECINNMDAEELLCAAAIRLLQNIALFLSNDDIFLLLSSRDQIFAELWALFTSHSPSPSGRSYAELTNLLSPLVLTSLWEAVSSLTVRLISSATVNLVTPIGGSASWVLEQYLSTFQEVLPVP